MSISLFIEDTFFTALDAARSAALVRGDMETVDVISRAGIYRPLCPACGNTGRVYAGPPVPDNWFWTEESARYWNRKQIDGPFAACPKCHAAQVCEAA